MNRIAKQTLYALLVIGIALCLIAVSYNMGKADQSLADGVRIGYLQEQIRNASEELTQSRNRIAAQQRQITALGYEAKTNAWEKYFAAEQQVNDLRQRLDTLQPIAISAANRANSCDYALRQIGQARQANQTQGTEAALRILALLLR